MSVGWIRLHRDFVDSKLFSRSGNTVKVAVFVMLTANHKTTFYRGAEIKRGQLVRSINQIADACHVSRKAVRYALDQMVAESFIKIDYPFGAQQGHRLTVCNYDTYQCDNSDEGKEGSNEGNTYNNDKNEKKRYAAPAHAEKRETATLQKQESFARFWTEYPKKIAKPQAFKSFMKVSEDVEVLIAAVKRQKLSDQWTKDGGKFIPHPSTWLNGERWNDETASIPEVFRANGKTMMGVDTMNGMTVEQWRAARCQR